MTPKKGGKEKISFNTRGMKKACKRINRVFQKLALTTLEAYIVTRSIIDDMETEANKHDFDINEVYLDLKSQVIEKQKKKEKT